MKDDRRDRCPMTADGRDCAEPVCRGQPWSMPLEDRFLLIAAYWRTNLTLRQLARRSRRTPAPWAVCVGAVPGPS